ncbi:isochorismatase family protein [Acerihabitans sp. TG2]|uniref:isochorismatase family protein n=1 Tax=Acerihabitans sp. TG2 TaxID=3096008 RepID=UPI002B22BF7C|nr:isochorismatase family protein [Acerihabitans sp. TG2]MEA9391919.1 isochorismatase family protein [Acerihabitans sp. TG2]
MPNERVLLVIDMQNGVFATPRLNRAECVGRINQLSAGADVTIFIQHEEGEMTEGSESWRLLPELHLPTRYLTVKKTACDAFYRTKLEHTLSELGVHALTVCGCATDYCVDTTIKVAASKGYALTVAADAHTTADRTHVSAQQLIAQHNEVWAGLSIPGNAITLKTTQHILADWRGSPTARGEIDPNFSSPATP